MQAELDMKVIANSVNIERMISVRLRFVEHHFGGQMTDHAAVGLEGNPSLKYLLSLPTKLAGE